jgi:SH3-like domain-containing protein
MDRTRLQRVTGLCLWMLAAGCAGLAVSGHASAEGVRPKPRPQLVAASVSQPAAETEAVQQTAAAAIEGGVEGGKAAAMLPLGPPVPQKSARAAPVVRDPNKGAVTNLPLPRFVSLKSGEGNARRGPGLSHRIDWVFTRVGMPLKITAEHGHWRRVEDAEGVGGWVHYALLSGVRSVMVAEARATFYNRATTSSQVAFEAEQGVVARVIGCASGWCRVSVDGQKGWVQVSSLWGVGADEVIE